MCLDSVSLALMGALGIITLSFIITQIVRYFVGIGIFCIFFLLGYAITGNANFSMFLALITGIFACGLFDWTVQNDVYSALLMIVVSAIGVAMAIVFLSNSWHYYGFNSLNPFKDLKMFLYHNRVTSSYKELLRILQQ